MLPSQVLGCRAGHHLARLVARALHGLAQQVHKALLSIPLCCWVGQRSTAVCAGDHSCMCTQCHTSCCVATTGHRVTSCEVKLLKLHLEGSCNLQLEPGKTLGSHSRHFHAHFLLRNMFSTRYSVKKTPTLLAWTNSFPSVRACWENQRSSRHTPWLATWHYLYPELDIHLLVTVRSSECHREKLG